MVQYTLAQCPEVILTIPGKESAKARDKAMDQLMELMDAGKLPTDLSDGFGPQQFIEVKEPASLGANVTVDKEDTVTEAVQVLSHLATLKMKVQSSRREAMEVRKLIDILFSDEPVDEADIAKLKEGFKVLKTFAQTNVRYREARSQAEHARAVLDRALSTTEPGASPAAEADAKAKNSTEKPKDVPAKSSNGSKQNGAK